jgi:hypothetical protein
MGNHDSLIRQLIRIFFKYIFQFIIPSLCSAKNKHKIGKELLQSLQRFHHSMRPDLGVSLREEKNLREKNFGEAWLE